MFAHFSLFSRNTRKNIRKINTSSRLFTRDGTCLRLNKGSFGLLSWTFDFSVLIVNMGQITDY